MLIPALAVTSCSEDDDNNDEQIAAIALLAAAQANANAVPENFVSACSLPASGLCQNAWNSAPAFTDTTCPSGSGGVIQNTPCSGENAFGECKVAASNVSFVYYAPLTEMLARGNCTVLGGAFTVEVTGTF